MAAGVRQLIWLLMAALLSAGAVGSGLGTHTETMITSTEEDPEIRSATKTDTGVSEGAAWRNLCPQRFTFCSSGLFQFTESVFLCTQSVFDF